MKNQITERTELALRIIGFLISMALLLLVPMMVLAAKGAPGKPGGGEETSGNNLSFPGSTLTSTVIAFWTPPEEGILGVHYSYGCDSVQTDGQYSYPNTSCVNNLAAPTIYYTAEQCADDILPSPCQGQAVSRIYWQKVADNRWSADQENIAGQIPKVAYLDWGDALEAVSWNERSILRVETQPYSSSLNGFDPALATCEKAAQGAGLPEDEVCKVGFQMWHVSGQGTTEQWGVRADEAEITYNYDSPYQIINNGAARLNLAKMAPEGVECPTSGGGSEGEGEVALAVNAAPGNFAWDEVLKRWKSADTGTTADPCTWMDNPYSVELSVGGKYVYGYNWRMKDVDLASLCGDDWLKTGWWRLTFYTEDDSIDFDSAEIPVSAPPAVPAESRLLPRSVFNAAKAVDTVPAESDVLYTPVVDPGNDLTYLDICIVAKTQGGGKQGGGGKPGGPK